MILHCPITTNILVEYVNVTVKGACTVLEKKYINIHFLKPEIIWEFVCLTIFSKHRDEV